MIKNYFKIAFRNLWNGKLFSATNIIGLALGIACTVLILLFIQDELSYDQFYKKIDNIYRVNTNMEVGGNTYKMSATSFPMVQAIKESFPEVKDAARIVNMHNPLIKKEDIAFYEDEFLWADENIFNILSYGFESGNPETALLQPFSVVITKQTAEKYFGNENPVGKVLQFENEYDLNVTGVLKSIPKNSTLKFDFIASFASLNTLLDEGLLQSWHSFYPIFTFITLNEEANPNLMEAKFPEFISTHMGDEILKTLGRKYELSLVPVKDIYLYSDRNSEMGQTSDINYIIIFSIVAVFILLLACINFMNLKIAASAKRIKEIGLRKVFGAFRIQLIYQFLGEAILTSLLALPLAYILIEAALPLFNSIAGKSMVLNLTDNFEFFIASIAIVLTVGLVSGSYPSFLLSRYNTSRAVKGEVKIGNSKNLLRQVLIVFQFSVAIVLIIGTAVIYNQLQFMQNKDLGINDEQVVVLEATDNSIDAKFEVFRNKLLQKAGIINAASSTYIPSKGIISTPYRLEGANDEQKWETTTFPVDYEINNTLGIELLAGRDFSMEFAEDTINSFIINEQAVKDFGFVTPENAVGKNLIWLGLGVDYVGKVIGVVKDFHYYSLEQEINPLVMIPKNLWPGGLNYISVKLTTKNVSENLETIEETWAEVFPGIPFRYSFLDEDFKNLYQSQLKLGKIFSSFSVISIVIALMGIFGLVSFMAESRTKEIGIRKVLGASVAGIINLISKEFMKLIVLSNLIAWPIAYYSMNKWLQEFAYRIEINPMIFLAGGVLTFLLSLLVVGMQSLKSATANPIKALKYE